MILDITNIYSIIELGVYSNFDEIVDAKYIFVFDEHYLILT